jgi:hypothetical protein
MSNELLQKALSGTVSDTGQLGVNANLSTTGEDGISGVKGGSGLLYPDQANRFLDYMWDATILAKQARTIRMRSNTTEIDRVAVGQRIMTVAQEDSPADYTGNNGGFTQSPATFSKISLTTRKLRLDWEISAEALEDNIEGPDLEDHIARLMATQAGNDVEDVLINGSGYNSSSTAPLMSAFKGFRQLALDQAHVVDAGGYGLDKLIFNQAIKAMPRKYKQRRNQLRFFAGSNLVQDYLYGLTNTTGNFLPFDISSGIIRGETAANDGGPGTVTPFAFGIPVINVPLMDETRAYNGISSKTGSIAGSHGEVHLTFPQNFIIGIKRDVVVYRLFQPKKDTIEYTLFIRVGCAIENYDAHVIVQNVRVAGDAAPAIGSLGSLGSDGSTVSNVNATRGSYVNFQPGVNNNTAQGSGLGTF